MKKNTPNIATHLMKSSDNYLAKLDHFLENLVWMRSHNYTIF